MHEYEVMMEGACYILLYIAGIFYALRINRVVGGTFSLHKPIPLRLNLTAIFQDSFRLFRHYGGKGAH